MASSLVQNKMAFDSQENRSNPSSPISTTVTSEPDSGQEDRSFSPRISLSRPPPSPKPIESIFLPMPTALSTFAMPQLPNTESSRTLSPKSMATSQFEPPDSITRPKSVPLFREEWAAAGSTLYPLRSKSVNTNQVSSMQKYRPSQLQPHLASLPPSTKPRIRAKFLRTEEQREKARQQRAYILAEHEEIVRVAEVAPVGEDEVYFNDRESVAPSLKANVIPDLPSENDKYIIVFSIRYQTFRKALRSQVFTSGDRHPVSELPSDIELPVWLPPLLPDGRMTIDEIPRWDRKMVIHWRSWDGQCARLYHKRVNLPKWLWLERNITLDGKGKRMNVFIERGHLIV